MALNTISRYVQRVETRCYNIHRAQGSLRENFKIQIQAQKSNAHTKRHRTHLLFRTIQQRKETTREACAHGLVCLPMIPLVFVMLFFP